MKLSDVADTGTRGSRTRDAYRAVPAARGGVAMDPERDALIAAIKAATIYAAIVIHLADAGDVFEPLAALRNFITDSSVPESFSGYAVVQRGGAGANLIILAKALGSETVTPIRLPDDTSASKVVAFYDDSVTIKTDFVARIDLCSDAVCIAAVGSGGSAVPLWVPLTFIAASTNV